jgi:sulfite reductase (NADPH) hemoprotein beta-component
VQEEARRLSSRLVPRTPAYHSIWIEGKELDLGAEANAGFADPFYGRGYLPRKFKVAFAIPPLNDIDVFTNDAGFVAIEEQGRLAGYNVLAGGGMGMSHGNARTFPRLADVIGFIGPESEQVEAAAKAVVTIHRDFSDRANRRHARLKYVLAERGVEWFRKEMERRMGFPLAPPRPFQFTAQGDRLGWRRQSDGNYCLGLFVENGRIRDAGGCRLKSGLREAVKRLQPEIRLTPSQNILLAGLRPEQRAELETVLAGHGIAATNPFSRTRLASMACPALPTCGQALAESERFLPGLLDRLEAMLGGLGLQDEGLIVRMTGCPNGCVRTYIAEIAFVGKAPDKYQIYVGGNVAGDRLARLYRESVKGEDLLSELRPLLARYAQEREGGERFGDYCARAIGASAEAAKH